MSTRNPEIGQGGQVFKVTEVHAEGATAPDGAADLGDHFVKAHLYLKRDGTVVAHVHKQTIVWSWNEKGEHG